MKRPDESGFIMALALVILVVGSITVVPGMSTASNLLRINQLSESNTTAGYAAEAGMVYVMWKFNNNDNVTFPITLPEPINGLTVTITEAVPATTEGFSVFYTLKSAATQATVSKGQVIAQIIKNTGSSPFHYGIVSLDGDITLSNNSELESWPDGFANVYCNGNVYINTHSDIDGDIWASGTVTPAVPPFVFGTVYQHQPRGEFQLLDMTWYQDQADTGVPYTGDRTITSNCNLGPQHIYGNLVIDHATVTLKGVVWVDGTITIKHGTVKATAGATTNYLVCNGDFSFDSNSGAANYPTFMSNNGNISIASSSQYLGSLYAPNGSITMTSASLVTGSAVAKSFTMNNHGMIRYPLSMSTYTMPGMNGGSSSTITSYCYY